MIVTIAWWDLQDSDQTVDSLRTYLRDDGVAPWSEVPGMLLKQWIADRENDRWGAIMVWDGPESANGPLPPNHATTLIGYPPGHRLRFEVEASLQGFHTLTDLDRLGPVFESDTAAPTMTFRERS